MVSVAIMGTISLAMVQMMQNQLQTINYLEDKMAMMNLRNELAINLQSAAVCEQTLLGVRIKDEPQAVKIRDRNGKPILSNEPEESNLNKFETLLIDNITVKNIDVPTTMGNGWIEFQVNASRTRQGAGPPTFKPATYRTRVMVNSSRSVLSCDADRITALDCGRHKNGEKIVSKEGYCPERIIRTDMCVAGLWLLYEKKRDPDCK